MPLLRVSWRSSRVSTEVSTQNDPAEARAFPRKGSYGGVVCDRWVGGCGGSRKRVTMSPRSKGRAVFIACLQAGKAIKKVIKDVLSRTKLHCRVSLI